jgi:hypothetical protein
MKVEWPVPLLESRFDAFRSATEVALSEWSPAGMVRVIRQFDRSHSGALVMLVDLVPGAPPEPPELDGQFVVKADPVREWHGAGGEAKRHQTALDHSASFTKHIPELVRSGEASGCSVLLYRVAGSGLPTDGRPVSLDLIQPVDRLPDHGQTLSALEVVSRALLDSWNSAPAISTATPGHLLYDWLGYRLEAGRRATELRQQ